MWVYHLVLYNDTVHRAVYHHSQVVETFRTPFCIAGGAAISDEAVRDQARHDRGRGGRRDGVGAPAVHEHEQEEAFFV